MKKKQKEEKAETPIIDGDARPDMPVDPESKKEKNKQGSAEKEKFTTERMSDMNSLEDYKDAKK